MRSKREYGYIAFTALQATDLDEFKRIYAASLPNPLSKISYSLFLNIYIYTYIYTFFSHPDLRHGEKKGEIVALLLHRFTFAYIFLLEKKKNIKTSNSTSASRDI